MMIRFNSIIIFKLPGIKVYTDNDRSYISDRNSYRP